MKKRFLISITIVIIIVFSIILININNKNNYAESPLEEYLVKQNEIDNEIKKEINNKDNTIDNPKIIVNPYEISPLTALIIFRTEKEQSFELIINGENVGTTEKNQKHSIPIYGLYENHENVVKLVSDKEYEYIVKTSSVNVGEMKINKKSEKLDNKLYFLVGGQNPNNVAYDKDGNVRWYLDIDLAIDIDFLDNGRILIGNGNGSSYVGYTGVLEIDYLGKIYKEYLLSGGAHHSILKMPNGNYMISTGSSVEEISWDYIVEIDPKTGKNVKEINLVEIFRSIDSSFVDDIEGESTFAYNNSVHYDEKSNTLTLSLRKLNSIINLDYDTLKLNWIYGEKKYWTENFDEYFIERIDNSRTSYGQHSVFYSDNKFGFFDNHVLDIYGEKCETLLKTYSSADIYEIKDGKFKNIFSFNAGKKYFSPYLSSFLELENGNKLINYGYVLDKDEFKKVDCELDLYVKEPEVLLYETDEKGNVLLEATFKGQAKQFIYKHNLYNSKVPSFLIQEYELYKNY